MDSLFDDEEEEILDVPENTHNATLTDNETAILAVIREKGISLSTMNSLATFRSSLLARAKRNDVVLKVAETDEVYAALTDDQLVARINDRNSIIKATGKAPIAVPEVKDDAPAASTGDNYSAEDLAKLFRGKGN